MEDRAEELNKILRADENPTEAILDLIGGLERNQREVFQKTYDQMYPNEGGLQKELDKKLKEITEEKQSIREQSFKLSIEITNEEQHKNFYLDIDKYEDMKVLCCVPYSIYGNTHESVSLLLLQLVV